MSITLRYDKGNQRRRIFVEGPDDFYVIGHWIEEEGLDGSFSIEQCGGIDGLLKVLPVAVKGSNVESICVVADANGNTSSRWQSIRDRMPDWFRSATDPDNPPPPEGFTLKIDGYPKVGVWLMPNNQDEGYLETFLLKLVHEGDQLIAVATDAVSRLPERRFSDVHLDKARIHTWLAWQETPGVPFGTAIRMKLFPLDCPLGTLFSGWIRNML